MRRAFFVLCVFGFVTGCSAIKRFNPAPAPAPALLRDLTPDERALLIAGFTTEMKDPNTVQLKWNRIGQPDEKGVAEYCAMIDGKNDYGTYVGFQPFIAQVFFIGGKIAGAKVTSVAYDAASAQAVERDCKAHGIDPHSAI
jgi:hypothetical protein